MKALLVACLLLTPFAAAAEEPSWVTYRDRPEGAFTVDVPAGWQVSGSLIHHTPTEVFWYVTAVSPDGKVSVAVGDPDLRPIRMPGQAPAVPPPPPPRVPGKKAPRLTHAPQLVLPYQRGAAFAMAHGSDLLQSGHFCAKLQVVGARDEPDPPHEQAGPARDVATGDGFLLCGDRGYVDYVIATTTRATPEAGSWDVALFGTALAPVEQAVPATDILLHMIGSWRFDPAWVARTKRASDGTPPFLLPLGSPAAASDWAATVAGNHDLAWHELQSIMQAAAEICPPDRKTIFPHSCGTSEQLPRR